MLESLEGKLRSLALTTWEMGNHWMLNFQGFRIVMEVLGHASLKPRVKWSILKMRLGHVKARHMEMASCCCCSVSNLCLTLCGPLDCSMPRLPFLYHLQESAQIHLHWVSGAFPPHLFAMKWWDQPGVSVNRDKGWVCLPREFGKVF